MFYGTELSPVSVAIGNINNFSRLLSRQSASTVVPPFNEIVWSFCWCPIGDLPRRTLISLFCLCDMVLQWLALWPNARSLLVQFSGSFALTRVFNSEPSVILTCTSSDRASSTQKGPKPGNQSLHLWAVSWQFWPQHCWIFLVERLGKPVPNIPSLKTKAH